MKTYTKAVSATLAGALAVGMVPAMALADDSVELLLAGDEADFALGTVAVAVDADGKKLDLDEDIVFTADGTAQYVDILEVTSGEGVAMEPGAVYYYKAATVAQGADRYASWAGANDSQTNNVVPVDVANAANWTAGTYYAAAAYASGADREDLVVVKFVIEPASLDGAFLYEHNTTDQTDVSDDVFTYTGSQLNLKLALAKAGDLESGDYSVVLYKKNPATNKFENKGTDIAVTEAGEYQLVITGAKEYTGSKETIDFTVEKLNLGKAAIVLKDGVAYDEVQSPIETADDYETVAALLESVNAVSDDALLNQLVVSYNSNYPSNETQLKAGEYTYTLSVASVDNSATAAIETNANIEGTATLKVVRYGTEATFTYDGDAITDALVEDFDPSEIKVKESAAKNAKDVAYTVTYEKQNPKKNNAYEEVSSISAPGSYKAVVTVQDNTYAFGGQKEIFFEVDATDIDASKNLFISLGGELVTADLTGTKAISYTGKDVLPDLSVKVVDEKGNALVQGTDYTVSVVNNKDQKTQVSEIKNVGTYTIEVAFVEGSKYAFAAGADTDLQIQITPAVITANLVDGVAAKTVDGKTKYAGKDALFTGSDINPIASFTVDFDINGDEEIDVKDVIEVPADAYSIVVKKYWDAEGNPATASTLPDTINAAGTYKFDIELAKGVENFVLADVSARTLDFEVIGDNVYADVKAGAWYAEEVYAAASNGWMTGYGNGMFGPNDGMKRGDLALALGRALGMDVEMTMITGITQSFIKVVTGFEDVDGGAYYAKAIKAMADAGIMTGYGDGTYGAEELVTREQLATILARIEASGLGGDSILMASALDAYADGDEVAGWAVAGVEWAVENGVMGVGTAYLNPGDDVTRAEVAAMLVRFDAKFDVFVVADEA